MMEKSVWRTSGHGSSLGGERGRKSSKFSRWEKRSVIYNHFTELVLDITEMEMLTSEFIALNFPLEFAIIIS
jgi:hypothetical protein